MTAVTEFSSATAGVLAELAALASQDLTSPVLPVGWDLLATIKSDTSQSQPVPPAQGFYAQGTLSAGGTMVAVLAVGARWKQLLENMYTTGPMLGPMPTGVATSASTSQFESVLSAMYAQLRAAIWSNLSRTGTRPLYVTGTGAGAALAQLAAIDLLPGNKGARGQAGPTSAPSSYVFSCPLAGNSAFATYFQQNVPAGYTVSVGSSSVAADLFPSAPTTALGYAAAGIQEIAATPLPCPDDPWVERSGNFYLSALGGSPVASPQTAGAVVNPPSGFNQTLAFALSQMCTLAYSRFQHPDLPFQLNTAPYALQGDVLSGGVPLCAVFSSTTSVVAAFRGMVTWQDLLAVQGNVSQVQATFLPPNAFVSQGALAVYLANTTSSSGTPFRQALAGILQSSASAGKNVYLTGHDFGGVLASIAGYDLVANGILTPAGLYTFGSPPPGTYTFASLFDATCGSWSYQIARPGDFAPQLNPLLTYNPISQAVSLTGVPPNDDSTQHSITGYMQLLNPGVAA